MPSSWSPTQHTSPKNRHQRRLEARFPKTAQQSMWYPPSMRVACHTCQCGCIGSHLYASDASDFHSSFSFIPKFLHIATQMFALKSERLSRMTNPPSVGMSELSDFRLAL